MTNLASLLIDHPFADRDPLLHTIERSMSAGEARGAARALADRLQAAGIRPGQAVTVSLPNGPEAVTAMAGVWLAGAVLVPINPRSPTSEIERALELAAPAAHLDASGLELRPGGRRYDAATAFVLWTSGTTGAPKAILHGHRAYVELIDRVLGPLRGGGGRARGEQAPAASRPSPNLIPVSLALNAGIYNTLFGLRAGAAIVIMDRFDTRDFSTLVRRFEIRSTVLPPAAISMLNDDTAITGLAPLRYVRSITAPLSPLQARRFTERFGAFVLNGYGQAEIGEVIGWTAADAKAFPDKIGAVGAHAGVDIKVTADDGRLAAAGQSGRLHIRPPNRALGYVGGGDLEDRVDGEGFVDTGDVARVDAEGFVWIEGRAGDVINRGGNKVFPAGVEEVLRLCPGVTDAAVVGVPDERLGEVPVAFLTGRPVAVEQLHRLCREHLAPYKIPVAFHLVDDLPRNESGKVLRSQLVSRHPGEGAGQP